MTSVKTFYSTGPRRNYMVEMVSLISFDDRDRF
jgi:hypothetical protein